MDYPVTPIACGGNGCGCPATVSYPSNGDRWGVRPSCSGCPGVRPCPRGADSAHGAPLPTAFPGHCPPLIIETLILDWFHQQAPPMSHQCRHRKRRRPLGDPNFILPILRMLLLMRRMRKGGGQEASQTWGQLGLARIGVGDKWWHHRAASSKTSCANTNYSRYSSHVFPKNGITTNVLY